MNRQTTCLHELESGGQEMEMKKTQLVHDDANKEGWRQLNNRLKLIKIVREII